MAGEKTITVSWETALKLALTIISLYILFLLKDTLVSVVFALVISILFNPAIDVMQKRLRIPRVLGASFIYIVFFGLFTLSIYLVAPILAHEIKNFVKVLPQYFSSVSPI